MGTLMARFLSMDSTVAPVDVQDSKQLESKLPRLTSKYDFRRQLE